MRRPGSPACSRTPHKKTYRRSVVRSSGNTRSAFSARGSDVISLAASDPNQMVRGSVLRSACAASIAARAFSHAASAAWFRSRPEYDVDRPELPDDTDEEGSHVVRRDLEAEAAKGVVRDGERALAALVLPEPPADGPVDDVGGNVHEVASLTVPSDAARS